MSWRILQNANHLPGSVIQFDAQRRLWAILSTLSGESNVVRVVLFFQSILVFLSLGLAGCDESSVSRSDSAPAVNAEAGSSAAAMPFSSEMCETILKRIVGISRSRPAAVTAPTFDREPMVRAYKQAVEDEGFDFDATLRLRLLLQSFPPPPCEMLGDFSVLPQHVDAALAAGLIGEDTARLTRLQHEYGGFALSKQTQSLVAAVEACEVATGAPCSLPDVCAHFGNEVRQEMASGYLVDCAGLFAYVEANGEAAGSMTLRSYFGTAHYSEDRFLLREDGLPYDAHKLYGAAARLAVNKPELAAFREAQAFAERQRQEVNAAAGQ